MAVLSKMDMIKALIKENKVEELKQEKDTELKLAARLFRQLNLKQVKEMYAEKIAKEPIAVIEAVTEKVEKVAKKPETKAAKEVKKIKVEETKTEKPKAEKAPKKKVNPKFLPAKDEKGYEYKKAWVIPVLDNAGFSKLGRSKYKRTLESKTYTQVYDRERNVVEVYKTSQIKKGVAEPALVNKTLAICPFIVEAFVKKYAI
uniref:Uncharacterized protein n=1 Tax=Siphoviridae sp. ctYh54 TaxID=2826379 RepID=A0A8S5ME48_9CAUD|nr:MAG TPA: hypothetical protein [Siphoviridae sp. ctYh54]